MAHALLGAFGFPQEPKLAGLNTVLEKMSQTRAKLHTADGPEELKGLVVDAGSRLEYAIQVLLRFVCQAALGQSPERYLRQRGKLKPTETLSVSLGRLLELLEFLAKELESGEDKWFETFRREVKVQRLAPKGVADIARLRNLFTHWSRDKVEEPLEKMRVTAQEFVEAASALLDYLGQGEGRIFPRVIAITGLNVDRWGRRTVLAEDETGAEERLFTDRRLEPGGGYYMHPLTSPMRVDPILVEAGDSGRGLGQGTRGRRTELAAGVRR